MNLHYVTTTITGLLALIISTSIAAQDTTILPGAEQEAMLENLELSDVYSQTDYKNSVKLNSATGRSKTVQNYSSMENLSDDVYEISNEALIVLEGSATEKNVKLLLDKYGLNVIETFPQIGIIRVQSNSPFNQVLPPAIMGPTLEEELNSEDVVETVAPNTLISPFNAESSKLISVKKGAELRDWGIADAQIAEVWPKLKPISHSLGVIDSGFYDHEDLAMQEGLQNIKQSKSNHGTHVSGIACALHNEKGVMGALPNCNVIIASRSKQFDFLFDDEDLTSFYALFGDIVATIFDFLVQNNDQVKTINLSLGYNWAPNFGRNPEDETEKGIRNLVAAQGVVFSRILAYANSKNVIIVSAAGNDSSNLEDPTSAEWASPFNWAAINMPANQASNALIVEAHDPAASRTYFSNDMGDISAPGLKILSTYGSPKDSYAELSGTSMAAPYVSAAAQAMRSLYPALPANKIIECLTGTGDSTLQGTPKLNLAKAITNCKLNKL